MKTVVFAYHDIGCEAISTLREMGEEICAVFTHEDDPNENVWFGSVKKCSEKLKIPTYMPENPNTPEWIEKIKTMNPDIIFSFYYRELICDDILAIPPKGALNLHGSLLPKYRGRAPVNWVLVNGEKETGLTLHYMIKKPDAGDIVAQKRITITDDDTALTLYRKFVPLTREILLKTIPLLANGAAPRIHQDEKKATTFSGRKPEDGKIDWTRSSEEIYNLVRAVTHPYPGAFTFLNGKKIFIWQSKKGGTAKKISGTPGTIISLKPLAISCGVGELIVEKIQSEHKSELNGSDWAKENQLQPGIVLR